MKQNNEFINSFTIEKRKYNYFSLDKVSKKFAIDLDKLPFTLKILLENIVRCTYGKPESEKQIEAFAGWIKGNGIYQQDIAYCPSRVLMQDFTGVPAIVDLAAMRDAVQNLGHDPLQVNPLVPVDLVIDHSIQVDYSATPGAMSKNTELEIQRNSERYLFLNWGQSSFKNFRVVPPGTGICHQVNLEYLGKVVWVTPGEQYNEFNTYPDTLVGTDSHTTMINGLSILGFGVGGIEAEAAMLGQPIFMNIPEVVGVKLTGALSEIATATDLVLTITSLLRERGVVNKFVEYYGEGLDSLTLADRATVANMSPEYGATCGFFPTDQETINYLSMTGREQDLCEVVEAYAKAQGLWHDSNSSTRVYSDHLEIDLSTIVPCVAGPKRPQDRVPLTEVPSVFTNVLPTMTKQAADVERKHEVTNKKYKLANGDVVIAAITSCTNTSNPYVMIAAGLLAKKARAMGLTVKPWVKTSLAPGSQVVSAYFTASNLQADLDALGFSLVGYGCTTCIGNSGPLDPDISETITRDDMAVAAVLSGNRNFEGRIHPLVKAAYLASPPLVVAYALAGTTMIDFEKEPLGYDSQTSTPIFLRDIWPSKKEVRNFVSTFLVQFQFKMVYETVFSGDEHWRSMKIQKSDTYPWDSGSTYIQNPPYFVGMNPEMENTVKSIKSANILAIFGDSITTDHISPAGNISKTSPAAQYLISHNVAPQDFNSYGARRGNHEVMMRGTFANIRIRNEMVPGVEGGMTLHIDSDQILPIYDAAMLYKEKKKPLIVIAGKEYGTGSSRDWAAKGSLLLGVKAVIAESFERIHRSNLVGMGILPLTFTAGVDRKSLALTGRELVDISLPEKISPLMTVEAIFHYQDGSTKTAKLICNINTAEEIEYYLNGGILPYVIRQMVAH